MRAFAVVKRQSGLGVVGVAPLEPSRDLAFGRWPVGDASQGNRVNAISW